MTDRGRNGFALIAALWAVTLLSTVALAMGLEQRSARLAVLNQADGARARAAADACLALAQDRLTELAERATRLDPSGGLNPVDPWAITDGFVSDTVRLGAAWCVLAVEDIGARLNVNTLDDAEIARFLLALRIDAADADRLAQSIGDWRDIDDDRRARGAEVSAYVEANLPVLPSNVPFASINELRHVMGMTPDRFARIRPFVTVKGGGRVSLFGAPPEVLLAFEGFTPEAVVRVLELRRDGRRIGHLAELAPHLSSGARAALLPHLPRLMDRIRMESTEVLARSEGGVTGGPVRVHASALFVRSAGAVHRIEQEFE